MENITCEKAKIAISITGLRGNCLRELYFKNVNIKARTGLITSNINDISLENVNITSLKE
jgi:hypothetical protein